MPRRSQAKVTGVWEKIPGSGIWWIRYRENGTLHREKVGWKSDALALYQKRKSCRLLSTIFARLGSPRINASASFKACDALIFTGMPCVTAPGSFRMARQRGMACRVLGFLLHRLQPRPSSWRRVICLRFRRCLAISQ
jgi:hypothetical protein